MRWVLNFENGKSPERVNHSSVSVGKFIYVFGGYSETTSSPIGLRPIDCFELNTQTLQWKKRPAPEKGSDQYNQTPYLRYGHTCVNYNDSVVLWGGCADWNFFTYCNLVYKYDPSMSLTIVIFMKAGVSQVSY